MSKTGETMDTGARLRCRALLYCVVCAGLAAAVPVQAERGNRQGERNETAQPRQGQSDSGAARAAAIAESRYGGKVLKVSPQGGGSYSVRLLLPDGTVKSVTVDAGD